MGYNYVCRTILIVLLSAIPAFAFQPKSEDSDLAKKAFSLRELYINTSILPLESAGTLPNRPALDRLARQQSKPVIYLDPRSGSISNLIGSIPLIPGKGNLLTKAEVSKILNRSVKSIDSNVVADLFRRFVIQNQESYGINVRQLGSIKVTQINDYLWHIHAPQTVNGIPVRRGRFLGVINHGNLVVSGSEFWGNANIDPTPTITTSAATKIGFDFVGGRISADRTWKDPVLEILPTSPPQFTRGEAFDGPIGKGYGHRLAWVFGFQRAPELARWEMGVDAHSGEILFLVDRNNYIDKNIQGGVYPLTNTFICPTNPTCGTMQPDSPMPWANTGLAFPDDFTNGAGVFNLALPTTVTTTLSGKYVHMNDFCGAINENSTGSIDLGGTNGDTDCISGGASAGNTPASRSGFYEVNRLAETGRGYLPTNIWLQNQLTANMNIPSTCNAFWDGFTINFYKSGGGCRNTGEIAAVFDHEWGHGLDHNDSNGTLSDSSEGYADIASMYRLWASCVGYGFFETFDQACGSTADGTGFNNDESQVIGTQHCDTDCSGVRDADYTKHSDGLPDDVNFVCNLCAGGGGGSIDNAVPFDNAGPCGRQTHCAATPTRQAAWDFVARDLPAAGFDNNTSFIIADKLFYQGSGNIGLWHNCTCPSSSDGCGAGNAYMQWLAADDDNGDISDGTPHMVELNAAFGRHAMACPTPAPTNSGCSGGPTTAPTVTIQPKHNQNVLSWNSVTNASSYFVFRSEGYAGCDFGKALIATVTDTTYTDSEVVNGRTYSYVVMAVGSSSACFTPASSCVQAAPVPCAGVPEFTEGVYSCSDTVTLNLLDSDLAGSPSQNVTVTSNTEPVGEVVTLTATAPGSALFSGAIATTSNPPAPNGVLSVTDGDTITVSYNDASACGPADTTTASVPVDCVAPNISNVNASAITEQSATVQWNTNEPANSRVTYGLAPGPPANIVEDLGNFVTAHSLNLTNLVQCSDYLFSVSSSDPAGNLTTDNNGGSFYPFTTTGVGIRFNDDLESGGSNWTAAGTPLWHISTCRANSGTQSFKAGSVSCPGSYPDDAFATLTSANPIPLGPPGHGYHLTYYEFLDTEATFDPVFVQASNDGGATWTTIDTYSGNSGGWVFKDYDLSAVGGANVLIRFALSSDSLPSGNEGWYIDDIRVARVTPCSGNLAHFDQSAIDDCPDGGPGDNDGILDPGESVSLSVTAENTGLSAVTGISATLSTTTPGITIINGSTTFANLPPESFAVSDTPFTFQIANSVGCRTFIDFTINYTANEGNWTDSFTLVLGGGDPFVMLAEAFESGIPATWTIVDGGSGGGAASTWNTTNPSGRVIGPPFSGLFAIADSDAAGTMAFLDEQLITPVLDASTCASLTLDFSNQFRSFSEGFIEVGDVDVSIDGGANWTNIISIVLDDGYPVPNTKNLDLTSIAAFEPTVQIRWHYYNANFDFWWAIDNVNVTCTPRVCQECIQTCLFCDDFADGTLPTDWTFKPLSNAWSEDGNNLVGASAKRASAIAAPAFSGCDNCSFETAMKTAGGAFNGLSLFGWYVDKQNNVELSMKEEKDRWVLKQRSAGSVVKKQKGLLQINPNQTYVARIVFDGTTFNVFIDGAMIISMTPGATVPVGTAGFKVKKTTGTFDYITVD